MSRLLVLGNAGMDVALPVPRLPLPGETLIGGAATRAPGGKGLNQAVTAARTGLLPVHLCAPVGDDVDGREVRAALLREPFASLSLTSAGQPTDLSVLLVLVDGENSIVTSGPSAAALSASAAAAFASGARPGDWLLMQGNLSEAATRAALDASHLHGAAVLLNTAPLAWDIRPLLPRCRVVVANAGEALALTGGHGAAAAARITALGAGAAVVTLGGEGCLVADGGDVRHLPAPRVALVDSTGAGDAFCGCLAALLATDVPLEAAAALSQQAAALAVTRHGAFPSLPDAAELRSILAW